MIGAIRSGTVSTLKWGVSLIGPVVVTNWAINKFEGLRDLNRSVPSARSGIIGLFSFALLPRLTGCGWKTALVASSILPVGIEIIRRSISKGHGGSPYGNDSIGKIQPDPKKSLVSEYDLFNPVRRFGDENCPFDIRFRDLEEPDKQNSWRSCLVSLMTGFPHGENSLELPFQGYNGETLVLTKDENFEFQLEGSVRNVRLWRINLTTHASGSENTRTERYKELLIAKEALIFANFEQRSNQLWRNFSQWCQRLSHISSWDGKPRIMFNNIVAPHDQLLSLYQSTDESGHIQATFIKHSTKNQGHDDLTLNVLWSKKHETCSISFTRDKTISRLYTFSHSYSDGLSITCNEELYTLESIGSQQVPEEISRNMKDIFEMMQMSCDFLFSPHTVVYYDDTYNNDCPAYGVDGSPIPYERLKQIAGYTNDAKGESLLLLEGDMVSWNNLEIEEYSLLEIDDVSQSYESDSEHSSSNPPSNNFSGSGSESNSE
ncbi:MAG: hypothetical protein KBA81_00880 [Rhabdochlamydiaceae bacterium]|nr:hypothetical protein [Rhabdochlamydiaceae bacterium]